MSVMATPDLLDRAIIPYSFADVDRLIALTPGTSAVGRCQGGQLVLTDSAEHFCDRVTYSGGYAIRLSPAAATPSVVTDPKHSFDQPALRVCVQKSSARSSGPELPVNPSRSSTCSQLKRWARHCGSR